MDREEAEGISDVYLSQPSAGTQSQYMLYSVMYVSLHRCGGIPSLILCPVG